MAAPILVLFKAKPAPRAHSLDVAANRRFVHLKQCCEFRWPDLFPAGYCDQHAELARLQSGAGQCAIINRRDHPIQLPDPTADAFPLDHFYLVDHRSIVCASISSQSRDNDVSSTETAFQENLPSRLYAILCEESPSLPRPLTDCLLLSAA